MKIYPTFVEAIADTENKMRDYSNLVHTEKWQGINIQSRPEMATHELMFHEIRVQMGHEKLDLYREQIKPNLPWADNHFEERVCGEPINPGEQWKHWPWGQSANKFRDEKGQFNHNYMERLWPRYAGMTPDGVVENPDELTPHKGIRKPYGDLEDLIQLLVREPYTRQAFIPLLFPEDTGALDRKPCTIGYQFFLRNGFFHLWYPMRSCDLRRHFRDDIYLAVRLLIWVLGQCRLKDPRTWNSVVPGIYKMDMTSLHVFRNDYNEMFK